MRDWYWSILIWMSWGSTSRQSESSLSLKMTSGAQQRQLFLRDCFPFFLTSFTLEINHFSSAGYFGLDKHKIQIYYPKKVGCTAH